jgi:hypothetical protein
VEGVNRDLVARDEEENLTVSATTR